MLDHSERREANRRWAKENPEETSRHFTKVSCQPKLKSARNTDVGSVQVQTHW